MKKILLEFMIILSGIILLSGCKNKNQENQLSSPKKGETVAEIKVKDFGSIYIKFFPNEAPEAVENFVTHAKEGYYDGITIYKIIKDSMLQSGDPTNTGNGGESIWGKYFKDEFSDNLQPYRGALCMANIGPDTNNSQFFIVQSGKTYNQKLLSQIEESYEIKFDDKAAANYAKVGGEPWLYRLHTVFGQVYNGYDVLDNIAKVNKTNEEQGIPAEKVIIEKVRIFKY